MSQKDDFNINSKEESKVDKFNINEEKGIVKIIITGYTYLQKMMKVIKKEKIVKIKLMLNKDNKRIKESNQL